MTGSPSPTLTAAEFTALALADYQKSSRSVPGEGDCVLVARQGSLVGVQDSKLDGDQRRAHTLVCTWRAFGALLNDLKDGRHASC